MGSASDHFGRRNVLISLAILGAACSFTIGWLYSEPAPLVLLVAALYGFAALGDSPVLSTAMTESVPKGSLGSALALRSILGFGAGGVAPFAFGLIRDVTPASSSWASAFAILGIGGLLAAGCAMLLPRDTRSAE
jgi:MFS family permease